MSFVHLHRHSEWSLLDGCGDAETYATRAAELGQTALAITDHGNMAGALYHMEACRKVGIKPIIGMEAYFRPDASIKDASAQKKYHLLLLAKNQVGFQNLMRITSKSHEPEYFYYKPTVDWDLLEQYSDGLVATTSCLSGYMPKMLQEGNEHEAMAYFKRMRDLFGEDLWVEIQPHDIADQRKLNLQLMDYIIDQGVGVIATGDVHYPYAEWRETQDILLMINTGQSLKKREEAKEDDDYMEFGNGQFWLSSESEIEQEFMAHHTGIPTETVQDAIANTQIVADGIEDIIFDKSPKLPKASPSRLQDERILREWCAEGMERIGKKDDVVYKARVERELALFKKQKMLGYFVIIGDMVRWAKSQGIRVGPGRGSAGGSLVLYLIGVTAMDPIGYDLLFERFMNEFRSDMPDVDIDFQHDRRDEITEYMRNKYGADCVVQVAAFQSFGPKSVIKDVARVWDLDYGDAVRATKDLDDAKGFGDTLDDLLESHPPVKEWAEKYPEAFEHCRRLEGQIKALSKHPAAIVVTDGPVRDYMPTMRSKDESIVTQWSARANAELVSNYGFLKIDMLVTDDLTTQSKTIELIKERHGVVIDFEDPEQFPEITNPELSDPAVVERFSHGMNMGIFQFGSSGIIGFLRKMKPENLNHLIAANALYRPGTLSNGMAFEWCRRKNGQMEWKLPHEATADVLGKTYAVITYQEQVMLLCIVLGDFEPNEAAVALKVVAKGVARDVEGRRKLDAYRDKFAEGAAKKGMSGDAITVLWGQILDMASYSFNRSHAAGYALQSYQDMWLKHYYPLEFFSALLSVKPEKAAAIIREARAFGIDILPPDINDSDIDFTIVDGAIRFGLLGIKQVGDNSINAIRKARPFSSFEDFEARVEKKQCNAQVKRCLLGAGAFDRFGMRTDGYMIPFHLAPSLGREGKDGKVKQTMWDSIFKGTDWTWSSLTRGRAEVELMGHRIEADPALLRAQDELKARVWDIAELEACESGETVVVGGEITAVKHSKTKKGQPMCFVDLSFGASDYSVTFFQDTLAYYEDILHEGAAILVSGEWNSAFDSVTADQVMTVEELMELEMEEAHAG